MIILVKENIFLEPFREATSKDVMICKIMEST